MNGAHAEVLAQAQVLAQREVARRTVAVKGERHWVVRKAVRGRRTVLAVTEVTAEERVQEVARLLGGSVTSAGPPAAQVAYARELLAKPATSPATGI